MDIDDDNLNQVASPYEERMSRGTAMEVLTRAELDLAYASEKVLNLEILLMQVAGKANDYEALSMGDEGIPTESLARAFEFDLLSGILNSEVKEIDNFMISLQTEIESASHKLFEGDHFDLSSTEIEAKLKDAEESLKQSQDRVADIRVHSQKFETNRVFGKHEAYETMENGNLSPMSADANWKLHTVEQQRHVLQLLEKSLARELDLEKELSDSRYHEEMLQKKLQYAEHEAYYMEESMEIILERILKAEICADLLMEISKELTGKLKVNQFNLNGSLRRECEMKSKLQKSMIKLSSGANALKELKFSCSKLRDLVVLQSKDLKTDINEAETRCCLACSETSTLRKKVKAIEEQLDASKSQMLQAKVLVEASQGQQNLLGVEHSELRNVIKGLKENVSETESRAETAEEKCTQLTKCNIELSEDLDFLKNDGSRSSDKASILERKLKESDIQLGHANASVEAIEEQQNILYSAHFDMENLIENLKGKVSKAESRAESAESNCALLTETNLELNEELSSLRVRLNCLEGSLGQTHDANAATAKDIGIRCKIISDLVAKLAPGRARFQLQIYALAERNKILAEKCLTTKDDVPRIMDHKGSEAGNGSGLLKSSEEALRERSTTFQVEKSATVLPPRNMGLVTNATTEDDSSGTVCELETVRTIEAAQLNLKYLFMAFIVLSISVVAFHLFQLENRSEF